MNRNMKGPVGCNTCNILYKSELVSLQHMLSVRHHKQYESEQRKAGKPISHFCPVCGVGNIADVDSWKLHIGSAFHKTNYDNYIQILYAQKRVMDQPRAKEASKIVQPDLDKKDGQSGGTFHNLHEDASHSHDDRVFRMDQSRRFVTTDDRRDIPVIPCSRIGAIGTRGRGSFRHHPDPGYPPQRPSFDTRHPPPSYIDRAPPVHHPPQPSLVYSTDEPFFTPDRRRGDMPGSHVYREHAGTPQGYRSNPSFSGPNDRYHYVRPRTPDNRTVFNYQHSSRYSEEPSFPSEAAHSRPPPEGYYRSHPHHHVDQPPRHSPDVRRMSSATHSHHSSRPSTSHANRSPDPSRHRISCTHIHNNRPSTSRGNRKKSRRSNRKRSSRSKSPDSSKRRISQGHRAPNIPPKSINQSNMEEGQDQSKLSSEIEDLQVENEPEILEVENSESTMDLNPEFDIVVTPEVVEQETGTQQEVQHRNSEEEGEDSNESLGYDPELFPSHRLRKKSREGVKRKSRKERGSKSAYTSQVEQRRQQEEDGERNQSTSTPFSPSDRQLAFMTTVQKTHEVSKLSDEIEHLNAYMAELTHHIRELKRKRNETKENKRELRRKRSVLLAEMNLSDSQAETGSSDNFDDTTPPRSPQTGLENPSAATSQANNPQLTEEVGTAEVPLKPEESNQLTDSCGRLIISIDDDEEEEVVEEERQTRSSSKRHRTISIGDSRDDSADQPPVVTEMPKRKRRRKDTLTQETSTTPRSKNRKRTSKIATESSENVPPSDQTDQDPTLPTPVNNTILLQTLGEAPVGDKTKPEEPALDTAADIPVAEGSRVNQKRLRFVRGLLSHPNCKDYTFDELDKLMRDYKNDQLLQSQKLKKNQE